MEGGFDDALDVRLRTWDFRRSARRSGVPVPPRTDVLLALRLALPASWLADPQSACSFAQSPSRSADLNLDSSQPLLWHHSDDPATLRLDEEFLFGSHVLVAPVTEKGATFRSIYLPSIANDGETQLQWCELDTGIWHAARADFITLGKLLSFSCV